MLINFNYLLQKYKLNITGIVQVGAHFCEEYHFYKENGIQKMIFFEPSKASYEVMLSNIGYDPGVKTFKVALSDKPGRMTLYTETRNQGQSSSLLKPKKHTEYYPDIVFDGEEIVDVNILDNYNCEGCNLLMLDCQGSEFLILKGASKTLENIDYIYSEVNREELYEGCGTVDKIDELLSKFGFVRVETEWTGQGWGDSFFIKKQASTSPIVELPDHLKISSQEANLIYPPNNYVIFEEYFASWYEKNAERFNLNRKYIPMNWTAYYVKNNYGNNVYKLQQFLDGLSRKEKYFTVTQYDDSIINKVSDLDLVVFSGGGRGNNGKNFPIPLTCLPNRTPKVEKDIFCSFIGRNTSKLRDKIFKTKFPDLFYIKEASDVGIDEYMQIMARSIFALCPRGYGLTSFRIAEALSVGTIPVYISNDFWKPFNNFDYGVTIHSSEIDSLAEVLTSISYFQVLDYKRQLESAYKNYFEYEALCHRIVEQIKNM